MASTPSVPSSLACLPRTRDNWLTDVLGVECWNVSSPTRQEAHHKGVLIAPVTGPAFLTAKVEVPHIVAVKRLTQLGFYLVDTALTLQCHPRFAHEVVRDSSTRVPNWEVVDATPRDADSVASIAAEALTTSRFHLDPKVPRVTASSVKSEWARSLALGHRGIGCRVVRDASGVQGFLGIVQGDDGQGSLIIDLIAVRPESQGRGAGAALVRDFLTRVHGQGALAQVGTQAANTTAVRLYERLGFTLTSATYVMHAHVPTEEPS